MAKNKKEPDDLNHPNDQNQKKKRKTVKYILLILLLLILAAIVAAAVHFYSLWRTAKDFERALDLERFSYAADVELEMDGLTEEQRSLVETLAWLTGLEQGEVLQLHFEGRVWEDRVYAEVSASGSSVPLIEVYLSKGDDLINASLFYDAVRSEIVGKNALLERLLPVVTEKAYMTMEQAEKLSGEDLSAIRNFEPFFSRYNISAVEYFAALAVLPHLEHGEGSVLVLKEVKELSQTEEEKISLYFEAEQPAQVVARNVDKYGKILSRLGIDIDGSGVKAVKRLAVTLSSEGAGEIVMPANVMSQEQFDKIEDTLSQIEDIVNLLQAFPQGSWMW